MTRNKLLGNKGASPLTHSIITLNSTNVKLYHIRDEEKKLLFFASPLNHSIKT